VLAISKNDNWDVSSSRNGLGFLGEFRTRFDVFLVEINAKGVQ
jgi:hypothetical protein